MQAKDELGEERPVEPTLLMQISLIPSGALQFDSVEVQRQAKEWRYVDMNITVVPIHRLHKLYLEIIDELKLHEKHTS